MLLQEIINDSDQHDVEDSNISEDDVSINSVSTPSLSDDSQLVSHNPSTSFTALETLIGSYLYLSDQIQTT